MLDLTPRDALARALYLRQLYRSYAGDKEWTAAIAWYEAEVLKPGGGQVKDSVIGQCVAKAEAVLRMIEAAGLDVIAKREPVETEREG